MILVCANVKGGTGKSCLAQNISVYFRNEKKASVMLVDADPQETTADWIMERRENETLSDIRFQKLSGNCRDDLLELEKHYDAVVVDCGGHDTATMRYALSAATHVLLPFRPKRRDLKLLSRLEEIIELVRPVNPNVIVRTLINQCPTLPSQVQRILDAKSACSSFELPPLNAIVSNRNIFDDCDESGASVFELGKDQKAVAEITAVAEELLEAK